ncbi:hypothetical protein SAMN05216552_100169 [Pseudoduganella namucuonensis]|uniref:Uncharacterized protein n=2 Tax=Pseudoduganella namucuonensis TaxID=1035707 RepID=A0A1I7ETZ8_9BURK|nr:hypothetical protein SAMN05216552_100169 [Pseudoduganella namucuonensis]
MTVPAIYQGLWRRTGIWRSDGSSDMSTQVWWLQAGRFHIDLRIPFDRPAPRDRAHVAVLPASQLARFGAQTGFAGATVVAGERCEWHPEIAFPALGEDLDAGWMRFKDADALHETGVDNSYEEDWVRMASGPMLGLRFEDPHSEAVAYLVAGERWMGWACGSPADVFDPQSPLAGEWTEITVLHKGGNWTVAGSTLPWLEGREVPAASALEPDRLRLWCVGDLVAIPYAPHHLWRLATID